MAHRGEPAFTVILCGGKVDLLPLCVERHPSQWHIIFPAEQTTDDPVFCPNRAQCCPITGSPDHSFGKRWNKLAVMTYKRSIRAKIEQGVIQCAAVNGALSYADSDCHLVRATSLSE